VVLPDGTSMKGARVDSTAASIRGEDLGKGGV